MTNQINGQAIAVVGLQFGSEGKGGISAYLSKIAQMSVRTGAANAGHTVYVGNNPITLRQLPSAFVNPDCDLVIGRGSIINLDILLKEMVQVEAIIPVRHRLFIDSNAHVTTSIHIEREGRNSLAERIASTSSRAGLGIAQTRVSKILRKEDCLLAKNVPELQSFVCDTVAEIYEQLDRDHIVLFEGTQGFGLSLEHGPFPFVTSQDTTAQSLFSVAGINTSAYKTRVIGVTRSYPIRVAGNSGPFSSDSEEVSWKTVAERAGTDIDFTEHTSVTKLTRRVATFSWQQFDEACFVNRPSEIALTFADYIDFSVRDRESLSGKVMRFVYQLEEVAGVPVTLIKTGPNTLMDLDPYRNSFLRRIA